MRIKRFTPFQRLFHLLLMLSFMVQAATGLGRMFIETGWGQWLTGIFGGYDGALAVHKAVGLFMIALFLVHLAYVLVVVFSGKARLWGADSLLPRPTDVGQFFKHLGWMVGLSKHPRFGRWGYWEKFDYWAVFWGMVIIGVTGLLLYTPVVSSNYIPGWGLNVAFWIHRIEAVLAIGHVFIIHFFIAHLRKSTFPMDKAMFEGSVDVEHAREERPAWVEGLEERGELSAATVPAASALRRSVYYVFGLIMVACGVVLLLQSLALVRFITW